MIPDNPEGRYRHYKGGLYRVIGLARHSETRESMIVYRSEGRDGNLWVRPAGMFFETVMIDGQQTSRFTRMD